MGRGRRGGVGGGEELFGLEMPLWGNVCLCGRLDNEFMILL